jgi:hypothetical protein
MLSSCKTLAAHTGGGSGNVGPHLLEHRLSSHARRCRESYFRSERKVERAEWESRIMSQLRHDPAGRKTHARVAVWDSLGQTYQWILESVTEVRPPQCIEVALEPGKLARGIVHDQEFNNRQEVDWRARRAASSRQHAHPSATLDLPSYPAATDSRVRCFGHAYCFVLFPDWITVILPFLSEVLPYDSKLHRTAAIA